MGRNGTRTSTRVNAVNYLDAIQAQFKDSPEVYNQFLDIMKEFKSSVIDAPVVMMRVSRLFSGHPRLIQGFNSFLPQGYSITSESRYIILTTPTGVTRFPAQGGGHGGYVDRDSLNMTMNIQVGGTTMTMADVGVAATMAGMRTGMTGHAGVRMDETDSAEE